MAPIRVRFRGHSCRKPVAGTNRRRSKMTPQPGNRTYDWPRAPDRSSSNRRIVLPTAPKRICTHDGWWCRAGPRLRGFRSPA